MGEEAPTSCKCYKIPQVIVKKLCFDTHLALDMYGWVQQELAPLSEPHVFPRWPVRVVSNVVLFERRGHNLE
jgi:hypothetical protein